MSLDDKPLVWLHERVKSPPFGAAARIEAGKLFRRLQRGETLSLPHSRPMPSIGPRVHELRIVDVDRSWRILYRVDPDAIVIATAFAKQTEQTPKRVVRTCQSRFRSYDHASEAE